MDVSKIFIYRIIPIVNLEDDLRNGLLSKNIAPINRNRIVIGNSEIIEERNKRPVKCYPNTVVNDYVPFYFSIRTPMLFNIITGRGVPAQKQEEIIYLCFKLDEIATEDFQWCFTNGNAAKIITRFYNRLEDLDQIDWRSIESEDFRFNNSDGDEDRIRKKHSEFLVFNQVPSDKLSHIVVLNLAAKRRVESILEMCKLNINVYINPTQKFYFL